MVAAIIASRRVDYMTHRFLANGLVIAVQSVSALILGIAGFSKLVERRAFASTLMQQGLLPRETVASISTIVPYIESVLAIALMVSVFIIGLRVPAIILAAAAVASFVCYLAFVCALRNPREICPCGALVHRTAFQGLWQGGLWFLALAASVVWLNTRNRAHGFISARST